MADTQVKSLVSEQYLDGWSYDDDDDDDETESSRTSQTASHKHQTKLTGFQVKRPHLDVDPTGDNSGPAEKKKFSMSMSSKGGGTGPASGGGLPPSSAAKLSMSLATASSAARKVATNIGPLTQKPKPGPIKMNLSSQSKPKASKDSGSTPSVMKSSAVAQAFGEDSDESEEEMPPEARMRMRNIGRETPTAAGPNSFGKSRLGFCDRQKIIERELQQNADD